MIRRYRHRRSYAATRPSAQQIVASMSPVFWARAGDAALSGGNITSAPNRGSLGGSMTPTGTIAVTASGNGFSAPFGTFSGTQSLTFSGSAASMKCLSDGLGCHIYRVFALTTLAQNSAIDATGDYNNFNTGMVLYTDSGVGNLVSAVRKGGSNASTATASSTLTANTPVVLGYSLLSGGSPEVRATLGATVVVSVATASAPNTGNPVGQFVIGASSGGGGAQASMRWAETFVVDRRLTLAEESSYRAYALSRYGF